MQTQRKTYNATYTSVALKREDYEDMNKVVAETERLGGVYSPRKD